MKRVKARVVPVATLTKVTQEQMYAIFSKYYNGVSWDQFLRDLTEKHDVIILVDSSKNLICGFSTLLWKYSIVNEKKVLGVFSGDTILEREYWGNPALGIKFLIYLFVLKLKNPFTPVYWFLISKGYKTYLLMAKNFPFSYPDYRRETPHFEKKLMEQYYSERLGSCYDPTTGIISYGDKETCRLKAAVPPITDEMKKRSPEIAYFENLNPYWNQGEELACLAKMTLGMPFRYFFKKMIWRRVTQIPNKPIGTLSPSRDESQAKSSVQI